MRHTPRREEDVRLSALNRDRTVGGRAHSIAFRRRIGIGLKAIAEHLPAYRTGRLRAEHMTDAMRSRIGEIDATVEEMRMQRLQILDHIHWIETQTTDRRRTPPTPDERLPDADT